MKTSLPKKTLTCRLAWKFCLVTLFSSTGLAADRPNVLWIIAEDASPHLGCYGETTIRTPHLDGLAKKSVRFTQAFVTNPVCSSSRSTMVTGIYSTTLGAHNHRSQRTSGKGGGNEAYYDSFKLPIPSIPSLFRKAGYHVTNAGMNKNGKTDYNFTSADMYDSGNWKQRKPGQPFFAQIQLSGGKARNAKVTHPVSPDRVQLPPYYPDHPVLRADWATYLNSWIKVDDEVGQIIDSLRQAGILDQTAIFFWTDHGVSHVRGKQYLYEEGIHVPLIMQLPRGQHAGTVRHDLVEHIDIAATSLALAGIVIPKHLQGRDLLAATYQPRQYIVSARDRCDETVDTIRCVRTKRWKYIRNFMSPLPHSQPNQYKDGKSIVKTMRQLHQDGKLNELQARVFTPSRPTEELYDLKNDPHETVNLASEPQHQQQLETSRGLLHDWMIENRDVGLIPEPILENLGRQYGSKYQVLQQESNATLVQELIQLTEAGERGDRQALLAAVASKRPSLRYWAATWLGHLKSSKDRKKLVALTRDTVPAVRVAATLALARMGDQQTYLPMLASHIEADNLLTGMYAIRALEQLGPAASAVLPAIKKAQKSPYEFTRRFAKRLSSQLDQ
jgi:arylsulfatase A-like enzyme